MNSKCFLYILAAFFFCTLNIQAQDNKMDTIVKIGNAGYKVSCNNKNLIDNPISISPVGFKKTVRDVNFVIKGRLKRTEIADVNNDGFPDLMLYIYGVPTSVTGTVICLTSVENSSLDQIFFPDIYDNPKLREGYKGRDEFSIRYGVLNRNFPVYKPGDADDAPSGGKRFIQYEVTKVDGRPSFKVLRSYEVAQ